jgi:hypothetical protein
MSLSFPSPPQLHGRSQTQFTRERPIPVEYELKELRYFVVSVGGFCLATWLRWNFFTAYIDSVSPLVIITMALLVIVAGCGLYVGLRFLVPQLLGYRTSLIIHPASPFEWRFSRPIASPTHYLICLVVPGLCVVLLALTGVWLASAPWLTFASIVLLPFAVAYTATDMQRGLRLLEILHCIRQRPMPRIFWYWRERTPTPPYGTII